MVFVCLFSFFKPNLYQASEKQSSKAPLGQVRDRPPPAKPEAPGGGGAAGHGFEPRCLPKDRLEERPTRPDPTRPDPRARSPEAGAALLTHAAALAGRARPRAAPSLHRLRSGGEAPPSARGALRRSSAAAPAGGGASGVRACAPFPGRFRSLLRPPAGVSPGRPAQHPLPPRPSAPPLETKVGSAGRWGETGDPAGAKSRENGLGGPVTPPAAPARHPGSRSWCQVR